MDLAGKDWRLVREEEREGPVNMALDGIAAETAASGGPRTVRVYRWKPPTLSLGYHQSIDSVDWDYCAREGIAVTRRPTGGGGIYHDSYGDISYSIVVPAEEVPGDLMESYELLLEPVFDALESMGVFAHLAEEERPALHQPACYLRELNPAHDVVVEGRKISGNAQHRQRDSVIQHGSITYERATERHLSTFADPGVSPGEFEGRVTSIREQSGIDREAAVSALESALAEWTDADEGDWTEEELAAARDLADEKFASEEWTRRH